MTSGKSTLSKELTQEDNTILLSKNETLAKLHSILGGHTRIIVAK